MMLKDLIGKKVYDKDSIEIGRITRLELDPALSIIERIFFKSGIFVGEGYLPFSLQKDFYSHDTYSLRNEERNYLNLFINLSM